MTVKQFLDEECWKETFPKLGDWGDCGNWAIAYHENHGGELVACIEGDIIQHAMVFINDKYVDATGHYTLRQLERRLNDDWGTDGFDIRVGCSTSFIMNGIKKTRRDRINYLKELL